MDPNTQAYYRSAKKLKLPIVDNKYVDGFNVRLGNRNYYFFSTMTPFNCAANLYLVNNKFVTNSILKNANIPVPKGVVITSDVFSYEKLNEITQNLKYPLVVKPNHWTHSGLDVVCGIPNIHSLFSQCELLFKVYDGLLIEEYHGDFPDFRVLIFQNKILDVVARFPARVIGNGVNTIQELVEVENEERLKISNILKPMDFDFEANISLHNQGLTRESIPPIGKTVDMGFTCNASRGGSVKVVPKEMCKENERLFLKIAQVLDTEFVGIDLRCKSLTEPMELTGGVFIEANVVPSVRIHEDGLGGEKHEVTLHMMRSLIYKHPFSYIYNLFKNHHNSMSLILHVIILSVAAVFAIVSTYRIFKHGALWIP